MAHEALTMWFGDDHDDGGRLLNFIGTIREKFSLGNSLMLNK